MRIFSAPGRDNRHATAELDPNVAAFPSVRNDRRAEATKSTGKLTTCHPTIDAPPRLLYP